MGFGLQVGDSVQWPSITRGKRLPLRWLLLRFISSVDYGSTSGASSSVTVAQALRALRVTRNVYHLSGKGIVRGVALQGTGGFRRDNDNDRAVLLLRFFGEILLIDALQGTCPLVIGSVVASGTLLRTA